MTAIEASIGVHVFVLTKNEQSNIDRCLTALGALGIPVTVMDSFSNDGTRKIVDMHKCATFLERKYINHCETYNFITTEHRCDAAYVMVLDADMIVSQDLFAEIRDALLTQACEVVKCPVQMRVEGKDLRFGSLYPPKPIVFRRGKQYFVPLGHGEHLIDDAKVTQTRLKLIHDDRKEFRTYLESQVRYSQNRVERASSRAVKLADRLRLKSPLMVIIGPITSYVFRLGFLSGRVGLIYALDRLIAEAIAFRQAQASKLKSNG